MSVVRRTMKRASVAALLTLLALPFAARAETPVPSCDAPLDVIRLANPLSRLTQKLTAGEPITIVAIGSSSTAGAGASSPAANYPSRLQAELRQRFPGHPINVFNRGVNGEEIADMLKRFDAAVVAAKPDLVLWQLGTNSVLRDHRLADRGASIRQGLAKIRATGADIVLIDPQYAPKVIAKPEAGPMVELLATTAKQEDVDLFPRFNVMKHWYNVDHMKFTSFVSPDGVHMNDWSYGCLAKALSVAIAEAAERPVMSAAMRCRTFVLGTTRLTDVPHALDCIQSHQQILDQIVWVLEAGREADQSIADAEFGALRGRQPLMRGRSWVRDQALGVAEIVGDADELQGIEEAEGALLAALDLERAQRRSRLHLPGDDVGLRMVGAAGIDQPADLLVAGERVRHRGRILGLLVHAQRQGLQTFQHHPGVERR